uniref:Uncharacterized protein n=1 Tax=Triticum urartu TaxID=4572 RepID=A0A8R7K4S6_TRIUA
MRKKSPSFQWRFRRRILAFRLFLSPAHLPLPSHPLSLPTPGSGSTCRRLDPASRRPCAVAVAAALLTRAPGRPAADSTPSQSSSGHRISSLPLSLRF